MTSVPAKISDEFIDYLKTIFRISLLEVVEKAQNLLGDLIAFENQEEAELVVKELKIFGVEAEVTPELVTPPKPETTKGRIIVIGMGENPTKVRALLRKYSKGLDLKASIDFSKAVGDGPQQIEIEAENVDEALSVLTEAGATVEVGNEASSETIGKKVSEEI
ncbi:MAG: hypothetical protein AAB842_02420, partial [Patescibacteria group bacterium]